MVQEAGLYQGETVPVQEAIELAEGFGILAEKEMEQTDAWLDRGFTAHTIANLLILEDKAVTISDIENHPYGEDIQAVVDAGLMDIENDSFDPDGYVAESEGIAILDAAIERLNNPSFEEKFEVEEDTAVNITGIEPVSFDEEEMKVEVTDSSSYEAGELVRFADEDHMMRVFTVEEVEGNVLHIAEADPLSYTSSIDISGEADLDFSQAEIIDGNASPLPTHSTVHSSFRKPIHHLETSGYDVDFEMDSSGISAEISKELPHGEELYASLKLNGIHVDYSWSSTRDNVKGAYFTVKCHTQEDFGVRIESYKKMYGDLSKLDPHDFLESMRTMFKEASTEAIEVPICTVRIPVANIPNITVKAQLLLKIYAGGRAQFTLSQNHLAGMEVRNGSPRLIHEYDHDETANLRSELAATGAVRFAFDLFKKSMMDISLEAGAKCAAVPVLHLYDEEGNHETYTESFSPDAADELAAGNPDVLVCTDINAWWVLKIELNSKESVLSKFGLSRTFNILDENNSSIFPGGRVHMENFSIVPSCTRKERIKETKVEEEVITSDKLIIDAYAKAVHIGSPKQIAITGMPDGYAKEDIVFSSSDSSIARVDANGNVTAICSGSAVITISTKDGKYYAKCSILVPVENPA